MRLQSLSYQPYRSIQFGKISRRPQLEWSVEAAEIRVDADEFFHMLVVLHGRKPGNPSRPSAGSSTGSSGGTGASPLAVRAGPAASRP